MSISANRLAEKLFEQDRKEGVFPRDMTFNKLDSDERASYYEQARNQISGEE